MAYRIQFLPSAARALEKLSIAVQRRVGTRIDRLAADPRPPGARKLRGTEDVWRLRVGDYRVLYQVEDDRLLILIIGLGHRRDVYR